MVRPDGLAQLTRRLRRIKNISLEFSEEQHRQYKYRPIAVHPKRVTHRLVFNKHREGELEEIKNGLASLVAEQVLKKARVEGIGPGDLEQAFELEKNYDSFGDFDYNQVIDDVQVDFNNLEASLSSSPMIKRLLEAACHPDIKDRLER